MKNIEIKSLEQLLHSYDADQETQLQIVNEVYRRVKVALDLLDDDPTKGQNAYDIVENGGEIDQ
ncbi:MAG: hypothetical protein LUH45_06790 [Clostridiales bacterium]|nr:hypothetical protein [Clostridiales bacterium]